MRLVLRRKASEGKDFGNWNRSFRKAFHHGVTETPRKTNGCNGLAVLGLYQFSLCLCDSEVKKRYSRTLSSSFLRSQSAAAFSKANTRGCGFFSVEDN